jgi:hypothetical protein
MMDKKLLIGTLSEVCSDGGGPNKNAKIINGCVLNKGGVFIGEWNI